MSHWFPESSVVNPQSGIAMVVALILLLVITLMGMGIAYMATVQSDMVAAVVNKPLSIDAAESCFDNAVEWLSTTPGKTWVNGVGAQQDLAVAGGPLNGNSMLIDTTPVGQSDTRSAVFKQRAGNAGYTSCMVEKVSSSTNGNTGNEIGTSNGYGASTFVYVIRITAVGGYNVAMNGQTIDTIRWQSAASRSVVEAVIQYTP